MSILNYTTKVSADKTVGEIQAILGRHGVRQIGIHYESQRAGEAPAPTALTFSLLLDGQAVSFRLPCRWTAVRRVLHHDPNVANRYCSDAQAQRVAWRIIKDWVEVQLALNQSQQAEIAEVFLPYAVRDDGRTMYEQFRQHLKALPPPEE